MIKAGIETCYMCDAPATSIEHIPPKCLFPEKKDLPKGFDLRKSLITVPSCDEHNSSTAKDDEYFMIIVAGHFQNNPVGEHHFASKVMRALEHSHGLRERIMQATKPAILDAKLTKMIFVEPERVQRQLDKIARGIYYSHFKKKWLKPLMVNTPSGFIANESWDAFWKGFSFNIQKVLKNESFFGENPTVFKYQTRYIPDYHLTVTQMVIYNGFIINAVYENDYQSG